MPYIESVCVAGKTIEIERYYTARYGRRGQQRAANRKPTREEQRAINNRQAEKKLRRILNANFSPGDYHLVLSYRKEKDSLPRAPEEMKEDIRKFLRSIRKEYKACGMELKYIHVPETGPKGARHHHLVLNRIDTEVFRRYWTLGFIHVNPLDDTYNYRQLAAYLIKYSCRTIGTEEQLNGKRWNASRNLIHPEPVKKVITNREWFRNEAKIPGKYKKDYKIDKTTIEYGTASAEYSGYGYFRFTLVMRC